MTVATKMMKPALYTYCRMLLLTVAVLLILFSVAFAVVRASSPLASVYRAELETFLGGMLATPVRIGGIDILWHGWEPRVMLHDVILPGDEAGTEPLRLSELSITFHWHRVLFGERLQIAGIQLRGAQIMLQRKAGGGVSLHGLSTGDTTDKASQLQPLFLADRIDLTDASITFEDATHGSEYLFPRADITIHNAGRRHRVYAQIDLPEVLGERVGVHLDFVGDPENTHSWQGSGHIVGHALQLAKFFEWVPDSPVVLLSGVANASIRGEWSTGELQILNASVQADELALLGSARLREAHAIPWGIDSASAHVHWQRSGSGWELVVGDIDIARDDQRWTPEGVRVAARKNARGETLITGSGRLISVAEVAALALALGSPYSDPVNVSLRADTLRAMRPRGELKNWQFEYNTALAMPEGAAFAGEFSEMTYHAVRGIPGIDGLQGTFRLVGRTLEIDVEAAGITVDAVPLFRQPIQLQRLSGRAQVQFTVDGVRVDASDMIVENADLKSRVSFTIESHDNAPMGMNIQAYFHDGQGHSVSRYLPIGVMNSDLVKWLDQAVVGGTIVRGTLSLRGDTEHFPYTGGEGVFEVECDVINATLKYHPDWPTVHGVAAHLRFLGSSLSVQASRGETLDSHFREVVARIADFGDPVVEVDGDLNSHVPALLHFAADGPLSDLFYALFKPVSGRGDARVALSLQLPIGKGSPALALEGSITLENASLHHGLIDTQFSHISGVLGFSHNGVHVEGLHMVALDAPLLLDAQTHRSNTVVDIRGNISARRLLKKLDMPFDNYVSGSSNWSAELTIAASRSRDQMGVTELRVSSDLLGTHITLPPPLAKPAHTARPLNLSVRVAGPHSLENWQVRYADIFNAKAKVALSPVRAHSVAVRFGGEEVAMLDAPGFYASGKLSTFDFDAWLDLLQAEFPNRLSQLSSASFDTFLEADLNFGNLYIFNKRIRDVALETEGSDQAWQLNIDSDIAKGFVRMPQPFNRAEALDIHFDYFDYDGLKSDYIESDPMAPASNPHSVLPFNINIKELLWQSYRFRNVKIIGRPHPQGMLLDPISIDNYFMVMRGTGLWGYYPELDEHTTSLTMGFKSENLGEALAEIGKEGAVSQGRGGVQIELNWPNPVYNPDIESLKGTVKLVFSDGRILTVDPSAGRLVSLLALRQLPRRLLFDFSDVLSEGMEFDHIDGGMHIAGGIASTELLRMRGSAGVVDIRGSSNLLDQTYDYTISVLPHLDASLPLIGILSGGLAAGLTVLLTENLLNELGIDINLLGLREHTLTGRWDDPVFKQIH